ncbi:MULTISPECIES: methylated-DNA--[protein]-cysteine S-methyltransferase [unclassified Moraxella]|uniref:methylated-DNA--[protein]-cysteine S-methyltransferase n=1 Tax=unclassified Moraxella TaxID=2685852 RepID=UPI003AF43FBE
MLSTTYQLSDTLPTITLVAKDGKLMALDWFTVKTEKILTKLTQQAKNIEPKDLVNLAVNTDNPNAEVLSQTISQLDEYLDGKRQTFDIPLDLSTGTPFQQKVWQALLQIPYGTTISYAQLANNIGQPTAFRAVANANGKNPISLIVPCHRVIASDGGLGGYTGGVGIKQILLDLER